MLNSLDLLMGISLVVTVACMIIIFVKFMHYFNNKKQILNDQRDNMRNVEILEAKLTEMKLKNTGRSLDENINLICNDEDVVFSMDWGKIIG